MHQNMSLYCYDQMVSYVKLIAISKKEIYTRMVCYMLCMYSFTFRHGTKIGNLANPFL